MTTTNKIYIFFYIYIDKYWKDSEKKLKSLKLTPVVNKILSQVNPFDKRSDNFFFLCKEKMGLIV